MKPGEVITKNEEIDLNKDFKVTKIKISNSGDRPVQVGSHYHFFETNEYLVFDRELFSLISKPQFFKISTPF